ncbi:MAG: aldehyde dehydrogenase family protein [Acidimicrobiia bacterium]|nr:aldehyde dehydrogenase family protein [Acidimicrobiia bacterium]
MISELTALEAGQVVCFGGNKAVTVTEELARAFGPGDRLVVDDHSGQLLHIPAREWDVAGGAVERAAIAFNQLGAVTDEAVTAFYHHFADRLADDTTFEPIATANAADVVSARQRGRSTTRLELTPVMRAAMIEGLRLWADAPSGRDRVVEVVEHPGWRVEQRQAGLGVIGFVFEGRPNVFADACGVLRSGNTVVFRIGSDALDTARAIVVRALEPARAAAGLPAGSAVLLDSPAHAAGWALFAHRGLALAVARGSGPAVAQLGAVARQSGTPVSLHGTGGAWMVAGTACDRARLTEVVAHSLDRKVCNTLNTCCVLRGRADELVPAVLDGLARAADARGAKPRLHVTSAAAGWVPDAWTGVELASDDELGREWEWEDDPEITLTVVDSVDHAVALFNAQSPRFTASLISSDEAEQRRFWDTVDAPFVGDGFTRWVDGQYALGRPELGLSNWQTGRLLARGGILSGDSVYTVRTWVRQADPGVHR